MKMLFTSIGASSNVSAWSGIPFYMSRAFTHCGFELTYAENLRDHRSISLTAISAFRSRILRQNYTTFRSPKALRHYAKQIRKEIEKHDPDVVFAWSTLPIAYLDVSKPIVFWTDSTFSGLLNFYPGYFDLSSSAIHEGHLAEQSAIDRCRFAIYSSEWAARSAIADYDADPKKVKVVPFGANLPTGLTDSEAEVVVENRRSQVCRLLFLAADWDRKGGDTAIEIGKLLARMGISVILTVVGSKPTGGKEVPDFVQLEGFVDKNTSEGNDKLRKILLESHFLLLPTRADCTPIVLSEANAFAVPSVCTDVGGVSSVVHDEVNGLVVSLKNAAEESACAIARFFSDFDRYRRLAMSSYHAYQIRLNWRSSADAVSQLINSRVIACQSE